MRCVRFGNGVPLLAVALGRRGRTGVLRINGVRGAIEPREIKEQQIP
ncbi:MAG: hypothetical protein K9L70_14945 [Thiohalocapsa sp.]|nr:hypothetical protein [Thiohalocapsa sp.]MCF7991472.1 hypothetical protein [Thiohalocapsa sp.]